jgi:sporulation protein YlmC with PRC-barrel domain
MACNTSNAATAVPITKLAHYQVVDLQGDLVAQVEDVLIAPDSGQISYVIVILERGPFHYSKAAFVEATVPRTAVPWTYFTLDAASAQLQLQVEKSVLYAAPRLTDKPDDLESDWDAPFLAYWQSHLPPNTQE